MKNSEKRKLVEDALNQDANRSNREIANQQQVSEAFVRKVRRDLGFPKSEEKGGRRPKELQWQYEIPNFGPQPSDSSLWELAVQETVAWKEKKVSERTSSIIEPPLEVPFPMFGGKGIAAKEVWRRFGDPAYYFEPFAGGLGVLLARPKIGKHEFVNDADGFITNFWRAVKGSPDDVASEADDPPNSLDLKAKVNWLKERQASLIASLETDPDFYDVKLASWWVWCRCSTFNLNNKIILRLGPGNGIHRERQRNNLYGYMWALAQRLEKVTIFHGDWTKLAVFALRNASPRGKSAIFLDPPYTRKTGRRANLYNHGSFEVGHYVQRWAVAAASTHLKIALCGHEGEYDMPPTWEKFEWKSIAGDGRERIWFSP